MFGIDSVRRSLVLSIFRLCFGIVTLSLASCSGPKIYQFVSTKEIQRRDNSIGRMLTPSFEKNIRISSFKFIESYLEKVARDLVREDDSLKGSSVRVKIIEKTEGKIHTFGLPGVTLYLSRSLLKEFEYENEVASYLAIQLAHIKNRYVILRLQEFLEDSEDMDDLSFELRVSQNIEEIRYFGNDGLFAFSKNALFESIPTAVELAYVAGYDPRGFFTVWKGYRKNLEESPYSLKFLMNLLSRTRKTVSKFAPLRNPIIQTNAYKQVRKRMEKL